MYACGASSSYGSKPASQSFGTDDCAAAESLGCRGMPICCSPRADAMRHGAMDYIGNASAFCRYAAPATRQSGYLRAQWNGSQYPRHSSSCEGPMNVSFPYRFDNRGRTNEASEEQHIRNLIEQLLFTSPGERVNRPTFGSGLMQLVFAANSPELAAATQLMVQGALQQWLGELIQVEAVDVTAEDATVRVQVRYIIRRTQQRRFAEFAKGAP